MFALEPWGSFGSMPRLVMLGTGTGVGKTWVSVTLTKALRHRGFDVLALKPVETGVPVSTPSRTFDSPPKGSDAALLEQSSDSPPPRPHPLLAFEDPVSPHLAARRAGRPIDLGRVQAWIEAAEQAQRTALHDNTSGAWSIIETAGGAFSPLSDHHDNFDLATALEPAIWLLVAPDALGVLHDVRATLGAMRARGRLPDALALSAARIPDASTGSNGAELRRLAIADPLVSFGADESKPVDWLERLLALAPSSEVGRR